MQAGAIGQGAGRGTGASSPGQMVSKSLADFIYICAQRSVRGIKCRARARRHLAPAITHGLKSLWARHAFALPPPTGALVRLNHLLEEATSSRISFVLMIALRQKPRVLFSAKSEKSHS